jgi:DNA (cytosine-5)-methyltransferase 1
MTEDVKMNGKKYSHFPQETDFYNHSPRYHSKRDIKIFKDLAEDSYFNYGKYKTTEALRRLYTEKTGKTSNVHKYNVYKVE